MELHQLRAFEVMAEELHFARAADRLGTTQSGVSRAIMALEASLGARLFNRSKRSSVTLTSPGAVFLPEACLILRQAERGKAVGRRAGRGEIGRIEIGFVASAAMGGTVSEFARRYRRTAPDVDLHMREQETPRQIEEICSGLLDVGFIRARARYPVEIDTVVLQRDRLVIAMQAGHPLAAKKALRPADVGDIGFIVPHFGDETGFVSGLHKLGAAGGFIPKLLDPARDFLTVLTAVAAGVGFGLVPAPVGNLHIPGAVLRPVHGVDLSSDLVMAYRHTETSPVIRQFVACAAKRA